MTRRDQLTPGPRFLGGLAVATLLGCAGCGPTSYEPAPRSSVNLSGHWLLDPAASDDAEKLIAASLPKPRPVRPQDSGQETMSSLTNPTAPGGGQRQGGGRGGSAASSQPMLANPPSWYRIGAGNLVRAFALPAPRVEISQQPAVVVIDQAGRHRSFEPGDDEPHSVTDHYGSRTVHAGWDKNDFVVDSSDGSHLKVVEHFRLLPGDRLESVVAFSAERLKSLKIHAVYRRATAAELEAQPPEGPPEPGPH